MPFREKIAQKLERLFLVCRSEWPSLLWMTGLNFLLSAGAVLAFAVINALFIMNLKDGFQKLPVAFTFAALILTPWFVFYNHLERKARRKWVLIMSFLAYGLLICLGRLGLVTNSKDFYFLTAIHVLTTSVLLLTDFQFWSFANFIFHPRQGKRLFPLLSMGGTLGAAIMGFSLLPLTNVIGRAENLLWIWAGFYAAAAVVVIVMFKKLKVPEDPIAGIKQSFFKSVKEDFQIVGRLPILKVIAVIIFIITLVSFLLYFQFYRVVGDDAAKYANPIDYFTGYVGTFYGYLNLTILAFQLFLTGRIVSRMGLIGSLFLYPVLLFLPVVASAFKTGGPVSTVYARFIDIFCRQTFFRTSSESIYGAVPDQDREQAMSFMKIIITPFSIGITGLALLGLMGALKEQAFIITKMVLPFLFIFWAFALWHLKELYIETLFGNFASGDEEVKLESFRALSQFAGTDTSKILKRTLQKGSPRMQKFALELSGEMEMKLLKSEVLEFIDSESAELKTEAIKALGKIGSKDLYPKLMKVYPSSDRCFKILILDSLEMIDKKSYDINAPLLVVEEQDKAVVAKLLVDIWKKGSLLTQQELILEELFKVEDPEVTKYVVRALGYDRDNKYGWELVRLLKNENRDVCLDAVRAAGSLGLEDAVPALIELLSSEDYGISALAVKSLIRIKKKASRLTASSISFEDPPEVLERKLLVLASASDSSDQDFFLSSISKVAPETALSPFEGFVRNLPAFRKFSKMETDVINGLLVEQVDRIAVEFAAVDSLKAVPDRDIHRDDAVCETLKMFIGERFDSRRKLVLLCLAILFPDEKILTLMDNVFSGNVRNRNVALEALENVLDPEYRKMVMPLFEKEDLSEEIRLICEMKRLAPMDSETVLRLFMESRRTWLEVWGAYAAGAMGVKSLEQHLRRFEKSKNGILAGEAKWSLGRLGLENYDDDKTTEKDGGIMLSTLQKILFLRQVDLFAEFSAAELGIIAQKAMEAAYSKGDVVFRQGDGGDSLYLVVGGKVRVVAENGDKRETIAILDEKSCFGEMAILSDETRSATIESADTSTLLKIEKEDFRELILKKPDMAFPIFDILIRRIRGATDLYMGKVTAEDRNQ